MKATVTTVSMQIKAQAAQIRVGQTLAQSTQVMKAMNNLVRLPELNATMMAMAREMEKTGLIEEMTEEAFEMIEPEDIEEAANEEIDTVLREIIGEQFAGVGAMSNVVPEVRARLDCANVALLGVRAPHEA